MGLPASGWRVSGEGGGPALSPNTSLSPGQGLSTDPKRELPSERCVCFCHNAT